MVVLLEGVGKDVPYNFIIIDSNLILHAKILDSISDWRRRIRRSAQVQRHRVRQLRGDQEI